MLTLVNTCFLPIFVFLNLKTNLMTNTSSSSKVLGVRMPFPEYMDLLQNAQENKMTISDFALQLILHNKNKPQQLGGGGSVLGTEQNNLFQQNEKLKRDLKFSQENYSKTVTELKQELQSERKHWGNLFKQINDLRITVGTVKSSESYNGVQSGYIVEFLLKNKYVGE